MADLNSCIAIFSSYSEALTAEQFLIKSYPKKRQIVLLKGNAAKNSISEINSHNYFYRIAVPKDTIEDYLNLLQDGSFLLIANGTYQDVELAYQILNKHGYISSIHLNFTK